MKLGYADPPYPGCAHLYREHPDYAGEVDYPELIESLNINFDGWVLHTSATPEAIALLAPLVAGKGARWMAWVKPFAAFKRNVSVAYAWEPVIVKPARKPVVSKRLVNRDWVSESITLRRGLTGAKPEAVCHWVFEMLGARPEDELSDLFPGTGAVTKAWRTWGLKFALPPSVPNGKPTLGEKVGARLFDELVATMAPDAYQPNGLPELDTTLLTPEMIEALQKPAMRTSEDAA